MWEFEVPVQEGSPDWLRYVDALKIRNRITHPTVGWDLTITDQQLEAVHTVACWFEQATMTVCKNAVERTLERKRRGQIEEEDALRRIAELEQTIAQKQALLDQGRAWESVAAGNVYETARLRTKDR